MITISLCMIVKNEEKVLDRCLTSIADIMDEIIIVDTGSNDSTKEIASRYTDKIYDFKWIDDFSAARNFSFSKATCDYIYAADADEVLDDENRKKFLDLKKILMPEIEVVQMLYCNQLSNGTVYNFDEEYRPKLFKRLRTFTWIEPVHETIRTFPVIYDSEIRINHMPEEVHSGRDIAIFEKQIGLGHELSKRLTHMYAMELYISGSDEEIIRAKDYFLKIMQNDDTGVDELREAACIVVKAAILLKDDALVMKAAFKNLLTSPSSEVCYELGNYFFEKKDYKEAALWYDNAINEAESILSIHTSTDLPESKLMECEEMIVLNKEK